jgi:hypothetical protein
VREAYSRVDTAHAEVARRFYSDTELALVPESASDLALGVGNHLRHAEIEPGEDRVDRVLEKWLGDGPWSWSTRRTWTHAR